MWLRVTLYRNGKFDRYGLVSNFSLRGVYVLCHQEDAVKVGQFVEIHFGEDVCGFGKICYVEGTVVRVKKDGIAVSFCNFDNNHFVSIQHILLAKHNMTYNTDQVVSTEGHQAA